MNQETVEVREFMLTAAQNAIESRAELDGDGNGQYDAEHDPEGYIISLLNALHQWCHVHEIDWDNELSRAQGFFEEDMAGVDCEIDFNEPVLFEDLRCPKCGHKESFVIEVSDCVVMYADGDISHSDCPEEWGDLSYCCCYECDHEGKVWNFRPKPKKEGTSHG